MRDSARLTSIDVLQTIADALKKFRGEATSATDDLDIELHRALEWIHHDRKEFWARTQRRCEERLAEAKLQLKQARAARSLGEYRPSCVDEQRAVERAKHQLQVAEEKNQAVRHWSTVIDRAVSNCQRARVQFSVWLDNDIQKGVSLLNRMADSLDNYVSVAVPSDPNAPTAAAVDSSQNKPADGDKAAGTDAANAGTGDAPS